MPHYRPPHRRRSVRLAHHDYAGGLYFVTVVTAGRRPLFGAVAGGVMRRSALGDIAHDEWVRTGFVRPTVWLDAFVVMPDHVHLLFGIAPTHGDAHGTPHRRGTPPVCPYNARRFGTALPDTVASIMRQYKSVVTKRIWADHGHAIGAVWQRGYHDRVVRTTREATNVRRYIRDNPARTGWRRP